MAGKRPTSIEPHRELCRVRVNGLSRWGDDRLLTAAFERGAHVRVWNVADGKQLASFGVPERVVCWLAVPSSRGWIAAGFGDLNVRLWNPSTGEERVLATPGGIVASLAWSADGKLLFTGNCGDNTVRLWDVDEGKVIAQAVTKKSATWQVAMSADAQRAVSGSGDKGVHVWDPRAGRELAVLEGHTGKILWLAFFPDGKRVVSASQDKSLRVWDLDSQRELLMLGGHTKQVVCAAVSPDGTSIASCSSDGTVRFWNAQTGQNERTFSHAGALPAAVEFSFDGKQLFVGWLDNVVRVYDVTPPARVDLDVLFSAVWADPTNDAPRAVLADALSERGDPRGEFISLQLARHAGSSTVESRRRERELLTTHHDSWVGPIAPLIEHAHVAFERGFVSECRLRAVKEAKRPKRHPAWSTITGFSADPKAPPALVAHLESLGARRLPDP